MNYINGIFHFLPGITQLFKKRGLAAAYLAVHWFFAYLLVDFAIELFSMSGAGEPFMTNIFVIDMFLIGSISLALVAIFYYYYLIGKTLNLISN